MNFRQTRLAGWISLLAGIWLLISPSFVTIVSSTQRSNDVILGIFLGAIGLIQAFYSDARMAWLNWINVILGIWLIIAPFVLGYSGPAIWNDVIVGVIVAGFGLWSGLSGGTATRTRAAM